MRPLPSKTDAPDGIKLGKDKMKMHRHILLAVILLFSAGIATAQDVILKKDNTTVLSKVLEITSTEIKYKKWSNQEGPTYSINRSEVTRINFQNGDVEQFTEQIVPVTPSQQTVVTHPEVQAAPIQPQPQAEPKPEKPKSPYARGRMQFSLNGGVAIPVGKFGTTDKNKLCAPFSFGGDELEIGCGAAKTGFNVSMKLHIPVYEQNKNIVGIPLKFNVMYNGFSDAEKRSYREQWQYIGHSMNEQYGSNAYQYQVTKYSNYLNFSIMGGGDYTHYFSKSFGLFVEANLGLNLAQITKANISNLLGGSEVYVDYDNYIQYHSGDGMEVRYKTKANFTYEIGGGLFLFDHFSIGVFYTGYSPFQVSPTWREYINGSSYTFSNGSGETTMEITAPKVQVSALSIQLGFHF